MEFFNKLIRSGPGDTYNNFLCLLNEKLSNYYMFEYFSVKYDIEYFLKEFEHQEEYNILFANVASGSMYIYNINGFYININHGSFYFACKIDDRHRFKDDYLKLKNKYEIKKESNVFYYLSKGMSGINEVRMKVDPNKVNLDYYDVNHEEINKSINSKKSGLILFHGEPGTGKSTYITNLINETDNLVFIASLDTIKQCTSSDILNYVVSRSYDNCVILVCEDCEDLICERSALTSAILNLTDGILSSGMKFKFLGTFNCPINKIDSALLRPGRLLYMGEFGKLSTIKSKQFAKENDIDSDLITGPMTLAELYNFNSPIVRENRTIKKIGY